MPKDNKETLSCPVCRGQQDDGEMMPVELLDEHLAIFIRKKHPDWLAFDTICLSCLNHVRDEYMQDLLAADKGELSILEEEVIRSFNEQELLTKNTNREFDLKLTFGQRVADKVAEFGGSWKFILIFAGVLVTWIIINSIALLWRPFDPYPFILLNLVLSCLAAIQAPIIMMSQNRQAEKDRLQADHDYRTNLKAELEIRQLNRKMDQLLMHHWQRLLEIQRIQTELMEEIVRRAPERSNTF